MFFGILAIVQAVFLPGFLAMRLARVRTGSLVEAAVLVFTLSLLINYLFVFLLTLMGAYGRVAVFALLVVEAVLLLLLLIQSRASLTTEGRRMQLHIPRPDRWLSASAIVTSVAVLGILVIAAVSLASRSRAFDAWDAVFSWNEWAYAWYQGFIPRPTYSYPQLIPAVWSMMYLIAGSGELQRFPLAIMPFFGVGILAMLLDLGLRRRRVEYLLGLLICVFLFWQWRGLLLAVNESALGGYVDIPVAFMAAATFYLIELRHDRRLRSWRELILPLIVGSAAAVTKLNGTYALAVVLILGILGHASARRRLSVRDWLKSGALTLAVIALVPGSWWFLKASEIASGKDLSNYEILEGNVIGMAGGGSILQRMSHALGMFPGSHVILVTLVILIALAVTVRRSRWVVLGVLLPYTLLWAYFLSYDLRNWLMMMPVAAYAAAAGACGVFERRWGVDMRLVVSRRVFTISPRALGVLTVTLVLCVGVASVRSPTSKLVADDLIEQRFVGNPYLNQVVYKKLTTEQSVEGDLLTDYAYLQVLPGFRNEPYRLESYDRFNVHYVSRFGVSVEDLEGRDCLLLSDLQDQAVNDAIEARVRSGEYTVLAKYDAAPRYSGGYGYPDFTVRLIKTSD